MHVYVGRVRSKRDYVVTATSHKDAVRMIARKARVSVDRVERVRLLGVAG
jgi:hypothetical protein